jgi:hypothetical protein
MPAGAQEDDAVQPQWTALYAAMELSPQVAPEAEVVIGVESDGEAVRAVLQHDSFEIRRGTFPDADITIAGPATLVGGVLTGLLTAKQAAGLGAEITGATSVLTNLFRLASRSRAKNGASS